MGRWVVVRGVQNVALYPLSSTCFLCVEPGLEPRGLPPRGLITIPGCSSSAAFGLCLSGFDPDRLCVFVFFPGCELKDGKQVTFNPEDDDFEHQLSIRMVCIKQEENPLFAYRWGEMHFYDRKVNRTKVNTKSHGME